MKIRKFFSIFAKKRKKVQKMEFFPDPPKIGQKPDFRRVRKKILGRIFRGKKLQKVSNTGYPPCLQLFAIFRPFFWAHFFCEFKKLKNCINSLTEWRKLIFLTKNVKFFAQQRHFVEIFVIGVPWGPEKRHLHVKVCVFQKKNKKILVFLLEINKNHAMEWYTKNNFVQKFIFDRNKRKNQFLMNFLQKVKNWFD